MKDSLCVREIFVEAIYDEIEFIVNILLRRFHPIDNSILRQQLLTLSFKMKKKIDSYFSRATANRHACNMYVGGETFDLKFQAGKEAKENRQREIDDRVKERWEAAERMRPVENGGRNVNDELDFIVDGLDEDVPYAKRILHTQIGK